MATRRTYGGGCAIAGALDVVGERWALLVVRELVLGPKRYTDLQAGLGGASHNVLSQRLREMEETGVVRRRRLGPPTSAWVYELTDWGRELEPVLVHLGRWGRRSPLHERDIRPDLSVDALVLALRAHFEPERAGDLAARYAVHLGEDRFVVRVADGELHVERGEWHDTDASVVTDIAGFTALVIHKKPFATVLDEGGAQVTGDREAVERLLSALADPVATAAR
ncbi:winged helix-turn-helix transcriptional regulator [Actinosynnema sp. NPDC023794]